MRFLHVNALGAAERRTLNGRHYLVAPVTMLVPGVLSGSQGPLLYPADEVAKDVQRWNHVPVTLGHPTDGHGRPISGRTDLALEKYQLGFILNTRFDGALRAEAWFDEEMVRRKAPTLLDRLRSRTVTELSTGLFTTDQPVANGVHSDGRPYVAVAREYRPDHLAILLDVKGACSAKDGCGVLVNETQGEQTSPARQCTCKDPESCDECKGTGLDQLVKKKGEKLEEVLNAFLGQPHSSDTGRFKRPNAGTGKAETRDGALLGSMVLTDQDVTLGTAAAVHAVMVGTPGAKPPWASDLAKWDRATALALKGGDPPDSHRYYAVTVHIYRGLGGGIVTNASAGLDMTPDKACKILHDGSVHGKPLTERQRGMFGARCGLGKKKGKKMKTNSFCPTGAGGGVDPSCGKSGGGSGKAGGGKIKKVRSAKDLPPAGTPFSVKGKSYVEVTGSARTDRSKTRYTMTPLSRSGRRPIELKVAHPAFSLEPGSRVFRRVENSSVHNQSSEDIKMVTKTEAIKTLTANCSCWKGRDKVLEAMDDGLVEAIHNQYEESTENALVVNELREEFGIDEDEVKTNAIPAFFKKKVKAKDVEPDDDDAVTDDDDDEDDGMTSSTKYKKNQEQTVTLNKQTLLAELGKLSQDEILGLPGMAGIRERDQLAQQILNRGKEEYVDRLTANVSDPKQREARKAHLRKLTLNELQDRLQDLPPVQTQNSARPAPAVYLGAGPTSFSPSKDDDYRPKPMEFPTINWAEEKKLLDAQQKLRAG